MNNTQRLIAVARGHEPADVVLRGGVIVNVFTESIEEGDVALCGDRIAGVGGSYDGREVVDVRGRYVLPGYIDGHVHVESSYLSMSQYARTVVPRGTTTVVSDLHEMANVAGLPGLRLLLRESRRTPLEVFLQAPSCVPCTGHLEASGARLGAAGGKTWGWGEMINSGAIRAADAQGLWKVAAAAGHPRDGHAPWVTGHDLNGYLAAGLASDHECTRLEEAREKLAPGMWLMVREGSAEKNLEDLLPAVTDATASRCMFVVDDRTCRDLVTDGDMDAILRKAVRLGMDPLRAVRLATLNPATYFGLRDHGALAPGYVANIVVADDLEGFQARAVFAKGRRVAEDGKALFEPNPFDLSSLTGTMRPRPFDERSFAVPAEGWQAPAVGVISGQIVTERRVVQPRVVHGRVEADPEHDVLKLVVIERHKGTGNIGRGFAVGFGMRQGAIGTSVAHDSHHIVVVGADDRDINAVAQEIARMGGGLAAANRGVVQARLPLPLGGLLSPEPVETVAKQLQALEDAATAWGCTLPAPFAALSFLALPLIPHVRVTDIGA